MTENNFYIKREDLISRLRGPNYIKVERTRGFEVKGTELAYLHNKTRETGKRNSSEGSRSWVEAKNEDSVVKD